MPTAKAPPQVQSVDFGQEPFQFNDDVLNSAHAVTLVMQQFRNAESFRTANYDPKWIEIDQLYQGTVKPRMWDNSDVPRSALPNNISFEHTEGPIARMASELFDTPDFFQVQAEGNTDPKDARKIQKFFEACLTDLDNRFVSGRDELKLALRDFVKYGTCVCFVEWLGDKFRGKLRHLDLRDVFMDPDCRSPFAEDARFGIHRSMVTAEELAEMRENNPKDEQGKEYLSIPSDDVIAYMLGVYSGTSADNTKNMSDRIKGIQASAGTADLLPFPDQNRIELLRYYDHKRVIWILGGAWPMLSRANDLGRLPFEFAAAREYTDKLYGMGYPEAIRWMQRLTEGLWNAHIDELALAMNPAVTGPRNVKAADMKIRPGRYAGIDNPKDMEIHKPPGITKDVMGEIRELEIMAERRNGSSSLDSSGIARPGNINRTVAGVNAQSEGGDTRLQNVLANFDSMIGRCLEKFRRMVQIYTRPGQVLLAGYKSQDGAYQAEPVTSDIFHNEAKISVVSAERMVSRNRVGQFLPMLLQSLMNPGMMGELHGIDMTVDIPEIIDMMQFATGCNKAWRIIRPLTDKEKQARNEPPPQVKAQMQKAEQDIQIRKYAVDQKTQSEMVGHQTEIQKAQIMKQPDPPDPMEQQRQQMEIAAKQEETRNKMMLGQQQVQVAAQKAQIQEQADRRKAETEQIKQFLEQQKLQMQAAASQQEHQMNLRTMVESNEMQRVQNAQNHQQAMQMAAQKAAMPKAPKEPKGNNE